MSCLTWRIWRCCAASRRVVLGWAVSASLRADLALAALEWASSRGGARTFRRLYTTPTARYRAGSTGRRNTSMTEVATAGTVTSWTRSRSLSTGACERRSVDALQQRHSTLFYNQMDQPVLLRPVEPRHQAPAWPNFVQAFIGAGTCVLLLRPWLAQQPEGFGGSWTMARRQRAPFSTWAVLSATSAGASTAASSSSR